ncbi:MAG: hypothetical protein ABIR51_09235, partial [Sphingomicrobium sp.]
MNEVSAPTIEVAPLEPAHRRISPIFPAMLARLETFLETERGQLPLWLVVAFGGGIAGWFWLGDSRQWIALILLGLAA